MWRVLHRLGFHKWNYWDNLYSYRTCDICDKRQRYFAADYASGWVDD